MTRLTECTPCQLGDHKRHHRTVQAVPKGMYGGSVCPCEGECQNEPKAVRARRFLDRALGPGVAERLYGKAGKRD